MWQLVPSLLVALGISAGTMAPAPVQPLAKSPEMIAWLTHHVPDRGTSETRLRRLHRALLRPRALGLEEAPESTATAVEAFVSRRANCVAFSHLAVALARELQLDVYFVLEESVVGLERRGDFRVIERHMALGHGPPERRIVLDFGGVSRVRPGRFAAISDRTANAIFHSNRGAEMLLREQPRAALGWLQTALWLDPELVSARSNMEVALYRNGLPSIFASWHHLGRQARSTRDERGFRLARLE